MLMLEDSAGGADATVGRSHRTRPCVIKCVKRWWTFKKCTRWEGCVKKHTCGVVHLPCRVGEHTHGVDQGTRHKVAPTTLKWSTNRLCPHHHPSLQCRVTTAGGLMASRRSPTRVALTGSSKNSRGLALTTPCAPHMCRVVCVSQRICSYACLCSALLSRDPLPATCCSLHQRC